MSGNYSGDPPEHTFHQSLYDDNRNFLPFGLKKTVQFTNQFRAARAPLQATFLLVPYEFDSVKVRTLVQSLNSIIIKPWWTLQHPT